VRVYENVFILTPTLSEEEVDRVVEQMQKVVEGKSAQVDKVEKWGKRSLAYKIKKHTEGYFVLFTISGGGEAIAELERKLKVTDTVLRFLTVRVDEDLKRQAKMQGRRESKKKHRKGGPPSPSAAVEFGRAQEETV